MAETITVRSLRELDKLIAERIFNWCDFWEGESYLMGYPPEESARVEVWEYSRDIRAAWAIVEHLGKPPYNRYFSINTCPASAHPQFGVRVSIQWFKPSEIHPTTQQTEGRTAPIAICIAALKTVGVEVELKIENG